MPGISPAFFSCRTHLSCQRHSPFLEIDQRQQGKSAIGILEQTTVAHLGKPIDALEWTERMLNLGAHLRFSAVGFLVPIRQWGVAAGAFVSEVTCFWRNLLEHFLLADVGTVTIQPCLITMKQIR